MVAWRLISWPVDLDLASPHVDIGLLAYETVAGVANLLPTSFVTRFARAQARGIDFATSNLRAAPFPFYVAGAKILANYPIGPVAGTAWNITVMSYAGSIDVGVLACRERVPEAHRLADRVAASIEELAKLADAALPEVPQLARRVA